MQSAKSRLGRSRTSKLTFAALAVAIGVLLINRIEPSVIETGPAANNVDSEFSMQVTTQRIVLTGHTQSLQHEQELLRIAATRFPKRKVTVDFSPLGVLPPHWVATTTTLLDALARLEFATATVIADDVKIRAVVRSETDWSRELTRLKAGASPTVSIDSDAIIVDAAPDIACESAFDNFDAGRIQFRESTAEFVASASPLLERILSLAKHCRHAIITITGHTDNSGDAILNLDLSRQRAGAIANFLETNGIETQRIRTIGAGASEPIASNSSRYGRGLNRRIEVEFRNITSVR